MTPYVGPLAIARRNGHCLPEFASDRGAVLALPNCAAIFALFLGIRVDCHES